MNSVPVLSYPRSGLHAISDAYQYSTKSSLLTTHHLPVMVPSIGLIRDPVDAITSNISMSLYFDRANSNEQTIKDFIYRYEEILDCMIDCSIMVVNYESIFNKTDEVISKIAQIQGDRVFRTGYVFDEEYKDKKDSGFGYLGSSKEYHGYEKVKALIKESDTSICYEKYKFIQKMPITL